MVNIEALVGTDTRVVAVICTQFGDSGKGKFSDLLVRDWADVCARGTGGANAGHTVIVQGKKKVLHLIPAGITYDSRGVTTILGQGMVIDPLELRKELTEISANGGTYNNLLISRDAHVVMPYHIEMDRSNKSQANGGIGSTGRGIGPAYADKIARIGITMHDLLDTDTLVGKLRRVRDSCPERKVDVDSIVATTEATSAAYDYMVTDTSSLLQEFMRQGKKIALEGAQGALLSVEHGTYPYVTSSDCTLNGTASGVGLCARDVDCVLGICKFPFMSKVGGGPFPTELGGKKSEEYCAEERSGVSVNTREAEAERHGTQSLLNSLDPFSQGIGIRMAADEYGATTGRPRRVGWTDAVAVRYAAQVSGVDKLVLTKPDSLSGIDAFNICYGYGLPGHPSEVFSRSPELLRKVVPEYKTYRGYSDFNSSESELPSTLLEAIEDFQKFVGAEVGAVSVGPGPDETIIF